MTEVNVSQHNNDKTLSRLHCRDDDANGASCHVGLCRMHPGHDSQQRTSLVRQASRRVRCHQRQRVSRLKEERLTASSLFKVKIKKRIKKLKSNPRDHVHCRPCAISYQDRECVCVKESTVRQCVFKHVYARMWVKNSDVGSGIQVCAVISAVDIQPVHHKANLLPFQIRCN